MKNYEIKAKGEVAEILLYGDIGDSMFSEGIGAKQFAEEIKALGDIKQLDIRINSAGGSIFEGIAIYNIIERAKAQKNIYVDGLAASAASIVSMAGDKIAIVENGLMMVHDPYGPTDGIGTVESYQKAIEVLEKVKISMIGIYRKKTGLPESELSNMMAQETWMTANEALAKGFVTEITKSAVQAMAFDLSGYGYRNVPRTIKTAPSAKMTGEERDKEAKKLLEQIDTEFWKSLKTLSAKERYEFFQREARKSLKEWSDEQMAWAKREGFLK